MTIVVTPVKLELTVAMNINVYPLRQEAVKLFKVINQVEPILQVATNNGKINGITWTIFLKKTTSNHNYAQDSHHQQGDLEEPMLNALYSPNNAQH
eukprot:2541612-Ditylum_brightwellii.AAC.1